MFKMLRILMNSFKLGNAGLTTGTRLKYGYEAGPHSEIDGANMQASQTLGAGGSYIVTSDSSGNLALTGAADTFLVGAIICGSGDVTSSTAGATVYALNVAVDAIYRIPVGSGTYSRTNRYKLCDLVVSSNVQKAAVQTSTRGHIQLLDGDETSSNAFVIARINPGKISAGNAA